MGWDAPFPDSPRSCCPLLSSYPCLGRAACPWDLLWGWELLRGSSPRGTLDDFWQPVSKGWDR